MLLGFLITILSSSVNAASVICDNAVQFTLNGTSAKPSYTGPAPIFNGTSAVFNGNQYINWGSWDSRLGSCGFSVTMKIEWTSFNSWARVIDFNSGDPGIGDMFLSIPTVRSPTLRFQYKENGVQQITDYRVPIVINKNYTIAVVYRPNIGKTGRIQIWMNGVVVVTNIGMKFKGTDKRFSRTFVGKSSYSIHSLLGAKIYSMKIYNTAIADADIEKAYVDAFSTPPTPVFTLDGISAKPSYKDNSIPPVFNGTSAVFEGDQFINWGPWESNLGSLGFSVVVKIQWTSYNSWSRIIDFSIDDWGVGDMYLALPAVDTTPLMFEYKENDEEQVTYLDFDGELYKNYTFAVVYDPNIGKTGRVQMWLNGVLAVTNTDLQYKATDRTFMNTNVAQSSYLSDYRLGANIYSLKIYNRALTEEEVTQEIYLATNIVGKEVPPVVCDNGAQFVLNGTSAWPSYTGTPPIFNGTDAVFNGNQYINWGSWDSRLGSCGFSVVIQIEWTSFNYWARVLEFSVGENGFRNMYVGLPGAKSSPLIFSYRVDGMSQVTDYDLDVELNTVYTIALSYNPKVGRTGVTQIWVDGKLVLINSGLEFKGTDRKFSNTYIGKSSYADHANLGAKIYSLKIYNRALTDAELSDAVISEKPLDSPTPTSSSTAAAPTATTSSIVSSSALNYTDSLFVKCPQKILCPINSSKCVPVDTTKWYYKLNYVDGYKLRELQAPYAPALIDPSYSTKFKSISATEMPVCSTSAFEQSIPIPVVQCEDGNYYFLQNYIGQSNWTDWTPNHYSGSSIKKILVKDSGINASPAILSTWGYHSNATYERKKCSNIPFTTTEKANIFFKGAILFCKDRNDFYIVSDWNNNLQRINYLNIGNYVLAWKKNAKAVMDEFKAFPELGCVFDSTGKRTWYCTLPNEIIFIDDCASAGSMSRPVTFLDSLMLNLPQLGGQYYTCDNDLANYVQVDYFSFPSKFMIKFIQKNNLCLDSSNNRVQVSTCDQNNPNQQWNYNYRTMLIKNFNNGKCIDDGGTTYSGQFNLSLTTCQLRNKNQQFVYDLNNKIFTNPNKQNLCIDDGGATGSGATRMKLSECNYMSPNQIFDFIPLTFPTKFLIRSVSKVGYCAQHDVLFFPGQPIHFFNCPKDESKNEIYSYDATTGQIKNQDLCIEDYENDEDPSLRDVSLKECSSGLKQSYSYDFETRMFKNQLYENICLGVVDIDDYYVRMRLASCDIEDKSQKFDLVPLLNLQPKVYPTRCSKECPPLLRHPTSGLDFRILNDGNLCLFSGGGGVGSWDDVLWCSGTYGKGFPPFSLQAQSDGNLVLRDKNSTITWSSRTSGPYGIYRLQLNEYGLTFADVSNTKVLWKVTVVSLLGFTGPTKFNSSSVNPRRIWQYLEKTDELRDIGYDGTVTMNDLYNSVPAIADCSFYSGFKPMTESNSKSMSNRLSNRVIIPSMPGAATKMQLNQFYCFTECSRNGLEKIKGPSCHSKGHFTNVTYSDGSLKMNCLKELVFSCAPGFVSYDRYLCGKNGECSASERNSIFTPSVCRGIYDSIGNLTSPVKTILNYCSPWKSTKNIAKCNRETTLLTNISPVRAYKRGVSETKDRIAELQTFLVSTETSPMGA